MVNANEIRAAIGKFLAHELVFDDFEDWIISHTWNISKWGDPESKHLAYSIELQLAEHVLHATTEQYLRGELQFLANNYLNFSNPIIVSTSTTSLAPVPIELKTPLVGMLHVTASELLTPR